MNAKEELKNINGETRCKWMEQEMWKKLMDLRECFTPLERVIIIYAYSLMKNDFLTPHFSFAPNYTFFKCWITYVIVVFL